MAAVEPAREKIARRLQDAVDRLRRDMDEVEFWTEVLSCLARPTPDYEGTDVLNRFALPPQGSEHAGEADPHAGEVNEFDRRDRPENSENRQPERCADRRHSSH
jgi:hypothetical protein